MWRDIKHSRELSETQQRIEQLEAENEKLRESLPLIDTRTIDEARKMIDGGERIHDDRGGSRTMVRLDDAREVVAGLLADIKWLQAENEKLRTFAKHRPSCPASSIAWQTLKPGPCDCGLDELQKGR